MMLIRTTLIAALILPILSIYVYLDAQEPGGTKPPTTKAIFAQAIQLLENRYSIQGDIAYQADLLGQQINGKGSYSELRSKRIPLIRMELKVPLDDKIGALAKVCDGRYLWTYTKVLDYEKLEQVDMDRVQEALEKKLGLSPTGYANPAAPVTNSAFSSLGVGGVANLLRQIDKSFEFGPATESKLDRMPILVFEGTWTRERLLRFLPKQKTAIEQGQSPDLSELPAHVPTLVRISLGARDLFPYRIEYLRTDKAKRNKEASPSGAGEGGTPLMTVYLYNVRFDQSIPEPLFDYRPGDLDPVDTTHEYIKELE